MRVITEEEVTRYLTAKLDAPGRPDDRSASAAKPYCDLAAAMRHGIDALLEKSNPRLRLRRLVEGFDLAPNHVDVLLLTMLPELDDRYARLFGYLQNDASDTVLRVKLATEILQPVLAGGPAGARDLFTPGSPLVAHRLIALGDGGTLGRRALHADDRITSFLLGSDEADARLNPIFSRPRDVADAMPPVVRKSVEAALDRLPAAIMAAIGSEGVRLLLTGPDPRLSDSVARSLCRQLPVALAEFDLAAAAARDQAAWDEALALAFREARLQDSALLCRHADVLCATDDRSRWTQFHAAATASAALVLATFDTSVVSAASAIADGSFWHVDLPAPDFATRERLWHAAMGEAPGAGAVASDLAQTFQLTASQVEDAVAAATQSARRDNEQFVTPRDLFDAARKQGGTRLVAFARRIEPRPSLSLDDVVLPLPNKKQLVDLQNRIRFNRELFQQSGLDETMRVGKGLLALFAGGSGTGKTLAAEALAAEAQTSGRAVDLHLVDLSAIVSKWVGETEKNITRIFVEAERSNGWLFFDEGESLFGTRGDTTKGGSAQDRLMNLEVSVLLQCVESFSGVVILATNLRQNIDPAFLRRIHAVVEFPQPAADSRSVMWHRMIPARQPRDFTSEDIDALAARFEISGGNIRNVVLDALFRAYATRGRTLTLRHIAGGLAREYQKLGRPITAAEFGQPLYGWIVEDILDPPVGVAQEVEA